MVGVSVFTIKMYNIAVIYIYIDTITCYIFDMVIYTIKIERSMHIRHMIIPFEKL